MKSQIERKQFAVTMEWIQILTPRQVESWKEDLSAKVGNAFEASRDAKGQPNLNNFALQCNLRGIAVQFANDGELLFTDANQHHKQVRADNLDPKFSRNSEAFKGRKCRNR